MNFENYLNLACVVGVILSVSSPLGNTFIQLVAATSFSFVLLLFCMLIGFLKFCMLLFFVPYVNFALYIPVIYLFMFIRAVSLLSVYPS